MSTFSDLVRATVARILQDKILLGLVIVAILGIFVGGFATSDEAPESIKRLQQQASGNSADAGHEDKTSAKIDPPLATDFVKWWMSGAMDYSPNSAGKNHEAAFRWMTPEAVQTFQGTLWPPNVADGVAQGRIVAAFQPVSVQAQAINPDGSIVVTIQGTLVTQSTGRPITRELQIDLLVKKESEGLRIAGMYNRLAAVPGSSVY